MGYIVIGFLVIGFLFPAVSVPGPNLRAQAKQDVRQIATALKQYEIEYAKPLNASDADQLPSPDLTVGLGTVHNSLIFDALRSLPAGWNSEFRLNPRKIIFFVGPSVRDRARPRAGFDDQPLIPEIKGCLFDPWGHEYLIRIHYNEEEPFFAPDGTTVKDDVIVWSLGKDGIQGTADDIVSWK